MVTIAIDALGGDHGLKSTLPAAVHALKQFPELRIILVGDENVLRRAMRKKKLAKHARLTIHHASEVVDMDESPALALRNKKDSSMRVAINLVKEGAAQACVSAGNTGALMATARFVLKMIPGIDRPAIIYEMPAVDKQSGERTSTHMLDLGANVECSADHLFQFAVMGSVIAEALDGNPSPRVSLLNIGSEEMKGLDNIKEAGQMLQNCSSLNYTGYVEGNDLFNGSTDVVVCDGFIGNIALKTAEGVAQFLGSTLKNAFARTWWAKICGIFAAPVLLRVKHKVDIRHYNGATFVGLKGLVVKSHGRAGPTAFFVAIKKALQEIEKDVPSLTHERVETLLQQLAEKKAQEELVAEHEG